MMVISEKTKEYWQEKDWHDVEKAESVADLFIVAKRIIERMPRPLVQVCGPIATGGMGSFEANLNIFNETIIELQKRGLNVFDQVPFELPMQKLKEKLTIEKCRNDIMNDFYLPLMKNGIISKFYFISSWRTSNGANWEHEKAKEFGIEINYL